MADYEKPHILFTELKKCTSSYDETQISNNGIYTLFENGENIDELDRVVKIGSHTVNNRLFTWIKEHYNNDNDRDIFFRKHLGIDQAIKYQVIKQ
ncbi:MAG: hypothetical protein GXO89_05575 [Chlorobi bacterium]|nr:hypothetical protein [Chlorobiota bacterium]